MTTEIVSVKTEKTKIPTTELNNLASSYGVELNEARLTSLAEVAAYYDEVHGNGQELRNYYDDDNGLKIGLPGDKIERCNNTAFSSPGLSRVDFTPAGVPIHMPTEASSFLRSGIHGLQNFVLLAEAGYVQKPAVFYGETNPQMAKVAERIGFTVTNRVENKRGDAPYADVVIASFEDIKARVFSREIQRLDALIAKRLMGKVAGSS